jgi:sugar phosphate isomerase/epimerase
MKFGICTSLDNAPAAKAAGWDYVEESVQALLQGEVADEKWGGEKKAKSSPLPVTAANMLVPASMKITGPDVHLGPMLEYLSRVIKRAKKVGIKTLVFGSGGARNAPKGLDPTRAQEQILAFARIAADVAKHAGVMIVLEPLNKGECNIINTVAEARWYVKKIDHPNFRLLVDSYHLWVENEPLENVAEAMPWIAHVHVADKDGRTAPGESGKADYRPLFHVLKSGGYDGGMSVEATSFDIPGRGAAVLQYLKDQWKGS